MWVRRLFTVPFPAVGLAGLCVILAGCQTGQTVSSRRLIEHQALIDFSGLGPVEKFDDLRVSMAPPRHWELLPPRSNALYSHLQWRSESGHTGVGAVFAHLPLPLSTQAVVWFAKQEYSKQSSDGKLINDWTDSLGRYWFEAENSRYHVRGYVVVKGFSAWVVYFGYRTHYPPDLAEISLAARAADTAVPRVDDQPAPQTPAVASIQH